MDYKKRYNKWLNEESLNEKEKQILRDYDEKTIYDAFYQDIDFGTGGLRGIMGLGTNRINVYTIKKATKGFADYLLKTKSNPEVVIGYDNRHNSKEFAYEAAKVLAYMKIKVYIFQELRPTPLVSFAIKHLKLDGGIMVTASHNPKEYNGYKVYNNYGGQVIVEEALEIIKLIAKNEDLFQIKSVDNEYIIRLDETVELAYLKRVKKLTVNQFLNKDLKIMYSPLHGTGSTLIVDLLKESGYDLEVVSSQMKSDPNFTNTKSSNPEDFIAYEKALIEAKKENSDIILLTDPDADRLGMAVKDKNDYTILNGNEIAAVMLYYLLNERPLENGAVYTTIVTSDIIKEIAAYYKQNIVETLTGFKFIAQWSKKFKNLHPYVFGCEESYGTLVSDFVADKDAVQAAFLLAEIAQKLKKEGKTIVDYLNLIYLKFGFYQQGALNYFFPGEEGALKINEIMSYLRKEGLLNINLDLIKTEDYQNGILLDNGVYLPPSNVVKFIYNSGWIAFRPSGTEPKLKVYFSTHNQEKKKAVEVLDFLINQVKQVIDSLK